MKKNQITKEKKKLIINYIKKHGGVVAFADMTEGIQKEHGVNITSRNINSLVSLGKIESVEIFDRKTLKRKFRGKAYKIKNDKNITKSKSKIII